MHPFLGQWGASDITAQRSNTVPGAISITSSGTAYNNVTPVELVASTAHDTMMVNLRCNTAISNTATRSDMVVELMAGAGGSEGTIIGPVTWGARQVGTRIMLPIFIPAGTRLSIRVRMTRLSLATTWSIDLHRGVNRDSSGLPQRWIAYGLVDNATSDARGTFVVPGATNAWGSWTSLTTSTTYAHDLWCPMVDGGTLNAGNVTAKATRSQFAIASTANAATMATNGTVWDEGALRTSTTEQVWQDMTFGTSVAGSQFGLANQGLLYHPAPAGSAVSARAMCSGTVDTNAFAASILAAL